MTRILYLHGFASSPASGKAQFFRRYLETRGARIEVPDLAAGDFEHLTITGQLAVIQRAAKGEPVSLIGSSMGGYLAALYAARHPEVPRLVLLAPAFGFARRWPASMGPERVDVWRRTGGMDVFHYGEGRMRRLSCDLLDDAPEYEDFPSFRQPALIFHGVHDDTVPVEASKEFAKTHSNVTLEVLNSGHQLTDVVDHMAPKVSKFLGLPA